MQNYNERGPKKRKKERRKKECNVPRYWEKAVGIGISLHGDPRADYVCLCMPSSQVLLDEEEGFVFDVNFLNGRPDPRVIGRFN